MVIIESVRSILSRNRQDDLPPSITFDTQPYGVIDPYPRFTPINSSRLNLLKGTSKHVGSNEGLIKITDGKLFLERNVNGGKVIQKEVKPTSLLLLSAHPHTDQYPLLSFEDIHPHHIFYLEKPLPIGIKTQEKLPFIVKKMRSYTRIPGLAFFQNNGELGIYVFVDGFVSKHIRVKVGLRVYCVMKMLNLMDLEGKEIEKSKKILTKLFLLEEMNTLIEKLGLNRREDIERIEEIFRKDFSDEFSTNL